MTHTLVQFTIRRAHRLSETIFTLRWAMLSNGALHPVNQQRMSMKGIVCDELTMIVEICE